MSQLLLAAIDFVHILNWNPRTIATLTYFFFFFAFGLGFILDFPSCCATQFLISVTFDVFPSFPRYSDRFFSSILTYLTKNIIEAVEFATPLKGRAHGGNRNHHIHHSSSNLSPNVERKKQPIWQYSRPHGVKNLVLRKKLPFIGRIQIPPSGRPQKVKTPKI